MQPDLLSNVTAASSWEWRDRGRTIRRHLLVSDCGYKAFRIRL